MKGRYQEGAYEYVLGYDPSTNNAAVARGNSLTTNGKSLPCNGLAEWGEEVKQWILTWKNPSSRGLESDFPVE